LTVRRFECFMGKDWKRLLREIKEGSGFLMQLETPPPSHSLPAPSSL